MKRKLSNKASIAKETQKELNIICSSLEELNVTYEKYYQKELNNAYISKKLVVMILLTQTKQI